MHEQIVTLYQNGFCGRPQDTIYFQVGSNGGMAFLTSISAYASNHKPASGAPAIPQAPSLSPPGLIQTILSTLVLLVFVVGT